MGGRKIGLCKVCGRKFTPKGQKKPMDVRADEADSSTDVLTDGSGEMKPLLDTLERKWG